MARPPMFKASEKQRIVLSVLRGEASVAEAARRNRCSETSIAKWRDQFVQGGAAALEAGAARGPSARESQLERQLDQVTSALGEAHVELRTSSRLSGHAPHAGPGEPANSSKGTKASGKMT